ncbi:MAG TPA: hypothetical protein VN282_27805 [Pyrinomonadaceae bacterium]|nr:hypothetical protein [Pyrinomonadaceae bacterium]
MHVAIGPVGLSLHLICCLIYHVPSHGLTGKKFTSHSDAAVSIMDSGPPAPAAPPAHPRRDCPDEKRVDNYTPRRSRRCPLTGEQLRNHPRVKKILDDAWRLSKYGQKDCQEIGGWIYRDKDGEIFAQYQEQDCGSCTRLRGHANPPLRVIPGTVIALFHTHPQPTDDLYWPDGPSPQDIELAFINKVPGLVKTDKGVHVYGPERGQWKAGPGSCR